MEPSNPDKLTPQTSDGSAPITSTRRSSLSTATKGLGALLIIFGLVIVVSVVISEVKRSSSPKSTSLYHAPAAVSITSAGFSPATIQVFPGQTVIWTNKDTSNHQVASDPYPIDNELAGFKDTQPTSQGDQYSFVFSKAGTYTYHDDLNPFKPLKGTVIVKQ